MKKKLVLSILAVASGIASSYGQGPGYIWLDNYLTSYGPLITYGPNSGGTLGAGIEAGFTVGLYFGEGAFAGSVAADPSGVAIPTSLHPLLQLGTGPGSTAQAGIYDIPPGVFVAFNLFQANSVGFRVSTLMVVAYSGDSYTSSTIRGHSAAFEMITTGNPDWIPAVGEYMSTFDVRVVPEPSTPALIGFGLTSLLFARRRE